MSQYGRYDKPLRGARGREATSQVRRSIGRENGGFGIRLTGASSYENNVVELNTGGTISGGTQTGSNLCDGNMTCP